MKSVGCFSRRLLIINKIALLIKQFNTAEIFFEYNNSFIIKKLIKLLPAFFRIAENLLISL